MTRATTSRPPTPDGRVCRDGPTPSMKREAPRGNGFAFCNLTHYRVWSLHCMHLQHTLNFEELDPPPPPAIRLRKKSCLKPIPAIGDRDRKLFDSAKDRKCACATYPGGGLLGHRQRPVCRGRIGAARDLAGIGGGQIPLALTAPPSIDDVRVRVPIPITRRLDQTSAEVREGNRA
jgi:hypothetical protein